jgi:hypothetical protein
MLNTTRFNNTENNENSKQTEKVEDGVFHHKAFYMRIHLVLLVGFGSTSSVRNAEMAATISRALHFLNQDFLGFFVDIVRNRTDCNG